MTEISSCTIHKLKPDEDGIDVLRHSLRSAIKNTTDLCSFLGLDPREGPELLTRPSGFSTLVTLEFAGRMRRGDWNDPLLRQVLPVGQEELITKDKSTGLNTFDVVGDIPATITPGLIHKYRGRALIISHGGCAIHCRYCFRRHFPYSSQHANDDRWRQAIDTIAKDSSINELILSGGDPLMHSDATLARQIQAVQAIPHISTLRIHTRIPVVCPGRVSEKLIALLASTRLKVVVVLHINHSREIDGELVSATQRLKSVCWLLNQTVLLAGINDCARELVSLSKNLFEADIAPYYLHLLDEVDGVGHFRVEHDRARNLHRQMRESLPGYLVPRLVQENAGQASKQWMN